MLINYASAFYIVMCASIVGALWLEALIPLDSKPPQLQHMARNFIIWLIAFLMADIVVGYYWLDFGSILFQQPFGLFYWIPLPGNWTLIVVGVVIIDLADYVFHRLSHRFHFLWRFHAVHHTDTSLDVSTSLRAHPVDLVLSNFWKVGVSLALGIPLWLVGFRELLIFPFIFLQHANIALPPRLERMLGLILITPVIHRVHHSVARAEHDSNYGEGLVWWDRLFGTFTAPTASRPEHYGVSEFGGEEHQSIEGMLLTPLKVARSSTR